MSTLVMVFSAAGLGACSSPSAAGPGDVSGADARVADAVPVLTTDAMPSPDAESGGCQPDSLRFLVGDRALAVGDYCDDIQLCAANADVAAEIISILPGFHCEMGGCPDGGVSCQWFDPDLIDGKEYTDLCLLTVIDNAPAQVSCHLYL